jgi:anti-anti-sigma factor
MGEELGNSFEVDIAQHFAGPVVKNTIANISQILEAGKTSLFVFNLKNTVLIDSSGIGALVSLAKEFRSKGARLLLRNLNSDLYQLFVDTGLDKIFSIEKDNGIKPPEVDLFENSVDIRLVINKEIVGAVCVFHMSGVMNHPIGSRFFKQQFLLSLAHNKKILIDLEELTFFDSLSLSAVLNMNNLLKNTGGSLRICSPNYIVKDLLSTLSIDQIIPIFETKAAALEDWDQQYV